ncbi:MAG: hypothetical protein E7179_00130 [Erysipelotrichaceae bacterium]|jgi:hypothetical protein|nr:hypothetical protein [Erysipelotrichaceae bacterium]
MKKTRDEKLHDKFVEKMSSFLKEGINKDIADSFHRGQNSYLRLDRLESSSFDESWIKAIEDVIFDLSEIVKNPRENTKTTGDITPVELAKKTTGESVQHLASHTQYIKEVDDLGNVVPSKILSFTKEDNILTYENRFIATFIRKLMLFVEKRYEFALRFSRLHDEEILFLKSKSTVEGADVEIETKVRVSSSSETATAKENSAYFARIAEIREYILYLYNSPFMKAFKTEHNVRNPILRTNIIRKNPKYRHCYEVYRYIESYSTLGVSYKMDEQYSLFSEEELRKLDYTLVASYLSVRGKDKSVETKGSVKEYKPRILTSLDDEAFLYGPYLRGPIEFVRVDEGYREYLRRLSSQELPAHPTKAEKAYYADEYQAKRDEKEFEKEADALLRRKEKEARDFEKKADEIEAERLDQKKRCEELVGVLLEKEQHDYLTRIRREIVMVGKAASEGKEFDPKSLPERFLTSYDEDLTDGETAPFEGGALRPYTMEELDKANKKAAQIDENSPQNPPKKQTDPAKGRFILKTVRGYYAGKEKYSQEEKDAMVFTDFAAALSMKERIGGKVIKR